MNGFQYPKKIVEVIFYELNQIQFFLQKPWRPLMKQRNSLLCLLLKYPENKRENVFKKIIFLFQLIFHFTLKITLTTTQFLLYLVTTPLRFINAFYFDIFQHCSSQFKDSWEEVFNPKKNMGVYKGIKYFFIYVIQLPYRILYYGCLRCFLITFEGIFFLFFDTVYPTLTLYHGTSKDAGYKITVPGNFKVGDGNYAGNGIYFGITIETALHYSESVIILTRVSLGRTINLNVTPLFIRNKVKNDGSTITQWGLKNNYISAEWWRQDGWWEYCLFQVQGFYSNPWRIRPIQIINIYTGERERVYGGMNYWLFRKDNVKPLYEKYLKKLHV